MHAPVDAAYIAKQKLSADWSADRFIPQVKPEVIEPLLHSLPRLDAEVKTRMLIACVLAVGKQSRDGKPEKERQDLLNLLRRLATLCKRDEDAWVKMMAAGAARLDGRLHLEDMEERSQLVADSMETLRRKVAASTNQALFPPLESKYLHGSSAPPRPPQHHFQVRANAPVPPLSAGTSTFVAQAAQAWSSAPALGHAQGPAGAHARRGAAAAAAAAAASEAEFMRRAQRVRAAQPLPRAGSLTASAGGLGHTKAVVLGADEARGLAKHAGSSGRGRVAGVVHTVLLAPGAAAAARDSGSGGGGAAAAAAAPSAQGAGGDESVEAGAAAEDAAGEGEGAAGERRLGGEEAAGGGDDSDGAVAPGRRRSLGGPVAEDAALERQVSALFADSDEDSREQEGGAAPARSGDGVDGGAAPAALVEEWTGEETLEDYDGAAAPPPVKRRRLQRLRSASSGGGAAVAAAAATAGGTVALLEEEIEDF